MPLYEYWDSISAVLFCKVKKPDAASAPDKAPVTTASA